MSASKKALNEILDVLEIWMEEFDLRGLLDDLCERVPSADKSISKSLITLRNEANKRYEY